MLRPIIEIDEEKCNGCGQCITDCAEGALEIVNGKAKLVSESYCDGLGACLNCPQNALKLSMREAPAFDEQAAMHAMKARKQTKTENCQPLPLKPLGFEDRLGQIPADVPSWPVQLALLSPGMQFLENADILFCAQCAGFSLPNIYADWIRGRIPVIACPKLQDNKMLVDKLASSLKGKKINSFTILRMSVPCCSRLLNIAESGLHAAGLKLPIQDTIVKL